MNWLSGVIRKQGYVLLENSRHAMLHAVALSLLPYTAWISVTIIALITLRKGWQQGFVILAPVSQRIACFCSLLFGGLCIAHDDKLASCFGVIFSAGASSGFVTTDIYA